MTRLFGENNLTIVLSILFVALMSEMQVSAQNTQPERRKIQVDSITPRPEDISSIDGIIKAFYEVISGPAGQPRQWARDRTLYTPGVKFFAMEIRDGKPFANVMTHQQFVDGSNDSMVKNGFIESEIHRVTQKFGNIAHVLSTYEARQKSGGPIIERGINSIQLYYDGKRWWITSAGWDSERADNPIPKEYLPK